MCQTVSVKAGQGAVRSVVSFFTVIIVKLIRMLFFFDHCKINNGAFGPCCSSDYLKSIMVFACFFSILNCLHLV